MATRTDLKTYDREYFEYLFPLAYPDADASTKNWIRDHMIQHGDITIESMAETTFSTLTGIKKISTESKDFKNGMDMKKATAWLNPKRPRREAVITSFHNKTGSLISLVYEPLTAEFYWFKFPTSAYADRASITVYFDLDGAPRTTSKRIDVSFNAWKYCIKQPSKGKLYVKRIFR